ncbi:MAG: hypothetical protein AAFO84_09260 [Cyanobacteria bacterium J06598_1]
MSYFFSVNRASSAAPLLGISAIALKTAQRLSIGLIGGFSLAVLPSLAIGFPSAMAQEPLSQAPTVPTARYANGENVDLAEIITEWRGYYADVPVYLCICQDGSCDQTQQWPYREYDRYQLSVALGPTNGKVAEASGANCFDIADGSRPSDPRDFSTALSTVQAGSTPSPMPSPTTSPTTSAPATPPATTPPARPASPTVEQPVAAPISPPASSTDLPTDQSAPASRPPNSGIPTATAINDGADIRLSWPSGLVNTVNVAGRNWNINILNALDCDSLSVVGEKMMVAQRVVGTPVVDESTGHVAVPVLLDSCVDSDQMAVFILDPSEGGGYALYRTQLPAVGGSSASGDRPPFPNEFSSYAYSTIQSVRYWDSSLLIRQSSASGAEVLSVFRPDRTPAGTYAGCAIVSEAEGANTLCGQ